MSSLFPHRLELTDNSLEITVFIMGLQIHNRFNYFASRFVKQSMYAILNELQVQKPDGYMAHEYVSKGRSSLLVQYWSDYEKMITYARNKSANHFPAWVAFNSKISAMDAIGLWHEIYRLPAGSYKGVYKNCPPSGMGRFLLSEEYRRFMDS